jgi:hypothetical protein
MTGRDVTEEMGMDAGKRGGLQKSLARTALALVGELALVAGIAAQFSYLVVHRGETAQFHLILIFGVLATSMLATLTAAAVAFRAEELWGNRRCRKVLGVDSRMLYKGEMFVLLAVLLGTAAGAGVWDLVTALNALSASGWEGAALAQEHLVLDLLAFSVSCPLWMHLIGGVVKVGAALAGGAHFALRTGRGDFCEV